MNIFQKAAEILVKCGYAPEIGDPQPTHDACLHMGGGKLQWVEPFTDTLEGRRQADAIEDWIGRTDNPKALLLWMKAGKIGSLNKNNHQWRLDRIKWCLQELIK